MKKFLILILSVFISFTAHAGNSFVEGMEDVPLPAGAQKLPARDFEFGNDDTQLVEAYYQIEASKFADIARFYRESMPQLGWKISHESTAAVVFERGDEELTVASESTSPLTIRLTLTGRPE